MKLIIAGGRDYHLTPADKAKLNRIPGVTEVVSGCQRGVDTDGEAWADGRGLPVKRFPADWEQYKHAAGPIRNRQMAEYADAVALFRGGNGTANMRQQAIERGLLVFDFELSRYNWLTLLDKAEQVLERIALRLRDGEKEPTRKVEVHIALSVWRGYGFVGQPSGQQIHALLSGNERLAAAALRRCVTESGVANGGDSVTER